MQRCYKLGFEIVTDTQAVHQSCIFKSAVDYQGVNNVLFFLNA
jgi:hypothetical protein